MRLCSVWSFFIQGCWFLSIYLPAISVSAIIEGVRIKTRLSHIFMKNEFRVYFIRKPDYAPFVYVTIPLHSLVTSYLRHLDVVSAKTGLSPCGLDPVFVLKTKATRWCPRESTQSRSDEISFQLTDFQ